MGYPSYVHDPDAVLDYQWDWSDWLGSDTIDSATVEVVDLDDDDDTNPVAVDSVSYDTTTVTARVSGGDIAFTPYTLTCHVVTAGGLEDDRSIALKIKER